MQTFKNKGSWLMAKGQIACRISNSDLDNLDSLSGLVIEEGTTAIIHIDGREVAQLNGGIYNFVEDPVVNEILDKRTVDTHSLRGMAVKAWRSLVKAVLGTKVGEDGRASRTDESHRTAQEIIRSLNSRSIIRVYLKADRNFPLIFASDPLSGELAPMKIRTKTLDGEFVVSMFMRITDFKAFIREYMPDSNSVMVADVQKSIAPLVENLLRRELQDEEIDEFGISKDAQERIASRLKGLNAFLYGVEIVQVLDIVCNNKEFERFRALSKELYCSEKELGYLSRTNEFKNRLAAENNRQMLQEAKTRAEVEEALDRINRDSLLNASEMERFKRQLMADDEKAALDVETFRMENMTAFTKRKLEIEQELYEIGARNRKKELLDSMDIEDMLRRHEQDKAIEEAGVKNTILAETLKGQGLVDSYQDERERIRHEQLLAKQKAGLDILQRMQDMEELEKDKEHVRKMDFANLDYRRHLAELQSDENLSDEKFFIKHGNLQGEAATVFAASFSAKHGAEQYRREAEEAKERERRYAEEAWRREQANDAKNERYTMMMKDMAEKGMGAVASVAGQRIDEGRFMKEEYRQQLYHEQERHDRHQETALNYTSKVSMAGPKEETRICPGCKKEIRGTDIFCEYCGIKL